MRIILICLLTIIIQSSIFGKCIHGAFYTPQNDTIKPESLILLDVVFYKENYDFKVIQELNNKYPVFLVSDSHKVDLEVLEINIGDVQIIQAVLKPKEKLIPGNLYKIVIKNLDKDSSYINMRCNIKNWNFEVAQWYVIESNDTILPRILSKPKFIKKHSKRYGDGPEVLVKFQLKSNKNNIVLVEAELKSRYGKSKNFILWMEEDNMVNVGRNMCSGGFELKYNSGYKVRFKLIDDNGNKSKNWSQWVTFTSPDDPYKNWKKMTLKNKKPALLLIDIQKTFLEEEYWGGNRNNKDAELISAKILSYWRENNLPLFHIRHSSTDPNSKLHKSNKGFDFNENVIPLDNEIVITKNVNSAFIGTDLKERLDEMKITTLVIIGLTTNHCISTTTRMAGNLGYETYLISDACATFNRIGLNGEVFDSELIHQTSLANLSDEFATIWDSGKLFEEMGEINGEF